MPTNVKPMKKVIIIIVITALVILAFLFFQKASKMKAFPSQAEIGNSSDPVPSSSFRGGIRSVVEDSTAQPAPENTPESRSPFQNQNSSAAPNIENESSVFSFAIIGDTQYFKSANSNGYFQTVVKDIATMNPDLIIATGDLVGSSDNYSEYAKKFSDWKKIDAPLLSKTYAAMGNHDNIENKGVKAWQDAFNFPTNGPAGYSETVYSFDFKNSHFVFLNSNHEKEHLVNAEQRTWLDQDLTKNKKTNTFVIFHEPAYPVSSKITEGLDKNPGERDALWQILKKYDVTAIFSGHEHIVSRRKVDGIYQFVFGSTDAFDHDLPGAGVAEYAVQGQGRFGIAQVKGKEITVKTYSADKKELNSFTFSK
jgi:3',5'-cyclic-AMP phosphodiesterase